MKRAMKRAMIATLTTLTTLGCVAADRKATPDSSVGVAAAPPTTSAAPAPPTATVTSPWAVTDSGAGTLRIGMTRDQLALDQHAVVPKHTRADSGCAYLAIPGIPAGMRTMWVAATLARIDVTAKKLPTDRGASVGDRESRIDSLYAGRITKMPAKYDPHGKYLVVHPVAGADSTRRIVFETDSTMRVSRYRVGREPEVEWVEGCS
jgi:hypothetical protein